jgi:hypothetical protein
MVEDRELAASDYDKQGASAAADFIRFFNADKGGRKKSAPQPIRESRTPIPESAKRIMQEIDGEPRPRLRKPERQVTEAEIEPPIRKVKKQESVEDMIQAVMRGEDPDRAARRLIRR